MTTSAMRRHVARRGLVGLTSAAALLTGLQAAAAAPGTDALPRHFELVAQSEGTTIWSERCVPAFKSRRSAAPRAVSVAPTGPQPDPDDLSVLGSALRRGDFLTSGVHVVETAAGPMLRLAGRHAGARDTYFMICDAAIRTSYD